MGETKMLNHYYIYIIQFNIMFFITNGIILLKINDTIVTSHIL